MISEHVRTIWAGSPAELDRAAERAGLLSLSGGSAVDKWAPAPGIGFAIDSSTARQIAHRVESSG